MAVDVPQDFGDTPERPAASVIGAQRRIAKDPLTPPVRETPIRIGGGPASAAFASGPRGARGVFSAVPILTLRVADTALSRASPFIFGPTRNMHRHE
ncbi:MAG TPA: hypothetical protein VGC51_14225 [Hansschlegelia sp.]